MESLKVLIPTDFSVQAEYAYLMVKKLEEKIPVEIHFMHVLGVPDTVTMDKNGNIQMTKNTLPRLKKVNFK